MRRYCGVLAAATFYSNQLKRKQGSWMLSKIELDVNKAGLSAVDKAQVNALIEGTSKGSAFYKNAKVMEEKRNQRYLRLMEKCEEYRRLSTTAKKALRDKVKLCEQELEAGRHFGNYIHVDMDMFYAAVEMKKDTSLATVPLAVGTLAMLSTTNYIARRYGVRSGMPGFIGRKLCPSLVIVPTDFDAYRAEAAVVRDIAFQYDPNFVSVGLDELTMEVTAYLQHHSDMTAADVAAEFRARVFAETQLTASAGIAPTATLSKIASNYNKPNGQHELCLRTREEVVNFMKDLPVRTVPGIGPVQDNIFSSLGIRTCGGLLRNSNKLCFLFPEKTFRFYLSAGLGVVASSAERMLLDRRQKTIGHEATFRRRLKSETELRSMALKALEEAHTVLLQRRELAQRIMLRLKRRSFENHTYSVTLKTATNDFAVLWKQTQGLLHPHLTLFNDFRLVGVRLGKLQTFSRRQLIANRERTRLVDQMIFKASVEESQKKVSTVRRSVSLVKYPTRKKRILYSI